MRLKNLLVIVTILIFIYLTPVALCQESKKAAAARVKNGTWSGTTSLGNEISFTVKDYKIVGLIYPINHSCGERTKVSGSINIPEFDVRIARATGTFQIRNLKMGDVGPTVTIHGRFRANEVVGMLIIAGICVAPVKIPWKAKYE